MIEIENVHKSFGALDVLKGVILTVEKGEVVSVIGGSGSGKSTLLTCINGLEPIQKGRILVDGTEVHAPGTDLNKLRRKIGIVFQQFNAFPHLTVLENVTLAPRKVLGLSRAEAEAIAEKQLAHVGLSDKLGVYPVAALRRPAAAHGDRPRAGHVARLHAVRRGHLGARPAARRRGARHAAACWRARA